MLDIVKWFTYTLSRTWGPITNFQNNLSRRYIFQQLATTQFKFLFYVKPCIHNIWHMWPSTGLHTTYSKCECDAKCEVRVDFHLIKIAPEFQNIHDLVRSASRNAKCDSRKMRSATRNAIHQGCEVRFEMRSASHQRCEVRLEMRFIKNAKCDSKCEVRPSY